MITRHSIDSIRTLLGPGALLVLAGACGSSAPTQQLVDARNTYQMAEASGTAQMAPNRMDDARQALDAAERAHKDDAGSIKEANLAYVAERKARTAMASGKTVAAMQRERQYNEQYQAKLESMQQSQQAKLQGHQAMEQSAQAEQSAQEARARAAEALANLGGVATVKQGPKGTVITLSNAVLFPTGEDTLSDDAHSALDRVAQALQRQPNGAEIRIEGYTDATGSAQTNDALSQRRADAVRDYLAQQGVQSAMLESIGKGESHPVASNATQDGRASNRRAEIVIQLPESQQGGMQKQAPPNSSAKTPEEKSNEPMQMNEPQPQPNENEQPMQMKDTE